MIHAVKVGPIIYELMEINGLRDGDEKIDGRIKYDLCKILLEANQSPQSQHVVLWHEIIHAILVQAGFRKHDERMIEALSYGIVSVLQDNHPELRKLIEERRTINNGGKPKRC